MKAAESGSTGELLSAAHPSHCKPHIEVLGGGSRSDAEFFLSLTRMDPFAIPMSATSTITTGVLPATNQIKLRSQERCHCASFGTGTTFRYSRLRTQRAGFTSSVSMS